MNSDRATKALLFIIALGIWLTVARPAASALTPATGNTSGPLSLTMVAMDDKGRFSAGGRGTVAFTASGLADALDWTAKEKLRVHSVVCPNVGGFVVLVEQRQPEQMP